MWEKRNSSTVPVVIYLKLSWCNPFGWHIFCSQCPFLDIILYVYWKKYIICKTVNHACLTERRQNVTWLHILSSLTAIIRWTIKHILRESDKICHSVFASKLSSCWQRLLKQCVCVCVCPLHYAAVHSRKEGTVHVWQIQFKENFSITISDLYYFLSLLVILKKWHIPDYFRVIYVCFGKNCVMYGRMLLVQTTVIGCNCWFGRFVCSALLVWLVLLYFIVCLYFSLCSTNSVCAKVYVFI
jgi:hypothetical protein